jgi:GAF domain-containing protein
MSSRTDKMYLINELAEEDYLTIVESFINLVRKRVSKKKVLASILPFALAASRADLGAFLAVKHVGADPAVEHGPQQTGDNLLLIAQQGMPDELIHLLIDGDFGYKLQQGKSLRVGLQTVQLSELQRLLRQHKLKYLYGLPVQANEHVLGAIIVGSRSNAGEGFSPQVKQRLAILTHMVALYLDKFRFQAGSQPGPASSEHNPVSQPPKRVKTAPNPDEASELEQLLAAMMAAEEEMASHSQDLDFLSTLSNEVSSTLHLNRVLNSAIKQTMTALKAEAGWCYVLEGDMLALTQQQGLSGRYTEQLKYLKPGDGTEGMAFIRNEPMLRDALLFHNEEMRALVTAERLRTVAACPLISEGKPFGVLAVGARQDRSWSSRDERMLISISQQVAQAAMNAQKFTEAEGKTHALEARNKMLQNLNYQQAEEVERLKAQTREILRLQERFWTDHAALKKARSKTHNENGDPLDLEYSQILASLRRALEVISVA